MSSKFRVPHTLVLLYGMIVVAYVLTLVLPAGQFDTVINDHGREVVEPGTFALLPDATAPSIWSLFTVIPRGLAAAQGIIFFVFIIGGALAVIRATGALDSALARVLDRFGGQPALLIFMGMLAFGIGSSTIGMAEEYIPLIAILITLCNGHAHGHGRGLGDHHGRLRGRIRHGRDQSVYGAGCPGSRRT